jgi:hypothetical protein
MPKCKDLLVEYVINNEPETAVIALLEIGNILESIDSTLKKALALYQQSRESEAMARALKGVE